MHALADLLSADACSMLHAKLLSTRVLASKRARVSPTGVSTKGIRRATAGKGRRAVACVRASR
eukprot:3222436-Pleurochrysis_carterae.AAC.1